MSFDNGPTLPGDAELGEQAAQWLLRLDDAEPDPDEEHQSGESRDRAFLEWIGSSPDHLRVFLETVETHRRLQLIDARHLMDVAALLRLKADVIPIHGLRPVFTARPYRKRANRGAIAAAALVAGALVCAGGYWWATERHAYATRIGEQRSAKLEDGSFIHLNTDSKVEMDFSAGTRHVRLVRGEALFVVERDSSRPFIVTAGDTAIRALGTQFNVRRNDRGAAVAVLHGAVQVTALDARGSPTQKLMAGEGTRVEEGRIAPLKRQPAAEAVAWRQRRLIFHDARLADIAAEFNRYNHNKFRIEEEAVKEIRLSGIFDADRPLALILFVAKTSELAVEPDGDDWLIHRH